MSLLLPGISAYNQFLKNDAPVNNGQQFLQPVQWEYSAEKVNDRVYELHLTATIKPGWHLYAQKQPEDAIAVPTTIKFNNNPLLTFSGQTKEIGKLEKFTEPSIGISAWQYEHKVDFVRVATVKKNVSTRVSGTITFQVCTPEQCLPPETVSFNIAINN